MTETVAARIDDTARTATISCLPGQHPYLPVAFSYRHVTKEIRHDGQDEVVRELEEKRVTTFWCPKCYKFESVQWV